MNHDLTVVTNGDITFKIPATAECSCGKIIDLDVYELYGDVTSMAFHAISKHAKEVPNA